MKISLSAIASEVENNYPVYCVPEDMFGGSHNGFRVQFIGAAGQNKQESLVRAIIKLLAKNHIHVYNYYFRHISRGDRFEADVETLVELNIELVEYTD